MTPAGPAPGPSPLRSAHEWLDVDPFLRQWPTPASWRDSLATAHAARSRRRATRHDSALVSGDFFQTPGTGLQNPPPRLASWPASQGSSDGSAGSRSSNPIGDRLNAELGFLTTTPWPQHGVPVELQNRISHPLTNLASRLTRDS